MIKLIYQKYLKCNQEVSTDTRNLKSGSLFIALKGANFNANHFVQEAIEKGAKYAIIDEEKYSIEGKTFLVEDCLLVLQKLAMFHRNNLTIPVIGITGSNGKTTSKELIGSALNKKYKVLITLGNLNNHIGVPLTLLKVKREHDIAIIEMGASKPGDIKELVEIAKPTHGLITNIGISHLEGFGTYENILSTKKELYDFIEKHNGVIFCNADDTILKEIIPENIKSVYYSRFKGDIAGQLKGIDPFVSLIWKNK